MTDRKHSHYFKPCPYGSIDVYRVLQLFNVTDPCLQHAIKKLLVAGGRGSGKNIDQDVQEAIDTLVRWQEMKREEKPPQLMMMTGVTQIVSQVTTIPGLDVVYGPGGRVT